MKKLLALVLALVMTLGLATVGSNAALDFADADKIGESKLEAVTVVDAIGVMKGDEQGFRPADVLTRAEGAVILARLYAGKAVADGLVGNGSKFTDVPADFWQGNGSGCIEYCAINGLLAGVGDNKFDPSGKLTTVAFTKMMLNALGYSTELEGYYGSDWSVKVMSRAQAIGLMKGLEDCKPNDQLNREQAAQLIFNTLKTPEVEYANKGTNLTVNGATIGISASDAKPVTNEERARQTIYDNRVNAQQNANGAFVVEFAEDHYPQLIRTETVDEFGRPTTTWTNGRTRLGEWENSDYWINEWSSNLTGDEVYDEIGSIAYQHYPLELYVDGVLTEELWNNNFVNYAANAANDLLKIKRDGGYLSNAGRGVLTTLYVKDGATDADSYARLVVINTYLAKAEADYNKNDETLYLGVWEAAGNQQFRTVALGDVTEDITGYKAGDYALVTITKPRTADAVVRSVVAPEVKVDTYVSKYTSNNFNKVNSVTAGETKINRAAKAFYDPEILEDYGLNTLKGFTYDIVMDAYGNFIGIVEHQTDTNYVFVVGVQTLSSYLSSTTYKANVIWTDGTMSTIDFKVNKTASAAATAALTYRNNAILGVNGNPTVNAWYTFTKDEAGNVTLTDIVPIDGTGTKQFAADAQRNVKGVADIGPAYTTLPAPAAGMRAVYGNDDTTYITVSASDSAAIANGDGVISGINGVSKGIKTTAINVDSVKTMDNFAEATALLMDGFATPNAWPNPKTLGGAGLATTANAFYLYNKLGYITYAIVVGDNAASAKNFVYVISGPSQRFYDGRYLDTYKVIKDNEITTIDVDSQKSGTNDRDKKLAAMRLHSVSYDKDGIVIAIGDVDKWGNWTSDGMLPRNAANLNTTDNARAGYTFTYTDGIGVAKNNNVLVEGNTMKVNPAGANQCYILLAADCKYFVYNPDTDEFDIYSNAKSALAAATKKVGTDQCVIGSVASIVSGTNGIANTVVIYCDYNGGGAGGTSTVSLVPGTYSTGSYANVAFYTEDSHDITYAEAIAALTAQMKRDGISDVEFTTMSTLLGAEPVANYTWNGMKVVMPITSMVNFVPTQMYKWTNTTTGTKGYLEETAPLTRTGLAAGSKIVLTSGSVFVGIKTITAADLMPDYDIEFTVVNGLNDSDALTKALADLGYVVLLTDPDLGNDFTVPADTLLVLFGTDLTVDGDLTVEGEITYFDEVNGGDIDVSESHDIIVDGGVIDLENNTLTFRNLITANDAKVVAYAANGDMIEVGCSLSFDKVTVNNIIFDGDCKSSELLIAEKLVRKDGVGKVNVTFGLIGTGKYILSLPADGKTELGNVWIDGTAMIENAGSIATATGTVDAELDISNDNGIVTNINTIDVNTKFKLSANNSNATVNNVTGNGDISMDKEITNDNGGATHVDDDVTVEGKSTVYVTLTGIEKNDVAGEVYVTTKDTVTLKFDKNVDVSGASVSMGGKYVDIGAASGNTLTVTISKEITSNRTITISGLNVKLTAAEKATTESKSVDVTFKFLVDDAGWDVANAQG